MDGFALWVAGAVRDGHTELTVLALIALATLVGARVGGALIPRMLPSASLIKSVVRISIVSIGILVALGTLGISVAPLLTALGVGGLAVALALRDTLANLFAGIALLAARQLRPGDFIRFDGGEGYLSDITWRNTRIRDAAGASIIVPNEKLAGAIVANASDGRSSVRIGVVFAVPAARDPTAFLHALCERMRELYGTRADVRITAISEAATTFAVDIAVAGDEDAFDARSRTLGAAAALLSVAG